MQRWQMSTTDTTGASKLSCHALQYLAYLADKTSYAHGTRAIKEQVEQRVAKIRRYRGWRSSKEPTTQDI